MVEKVCKLCGNKFIPRSNAQRYCDRIHTKSCKICGKDFEITWETKNKECCSKQCSQKLREQTMIERHGVAFSMQSKELQRKSEETSLKRYGVKHAAQSETIKEKTKKHFQEKYGVDWPVEASWFQEKSKNTCLEKYGVEFTSQIPGRTEKMQETNMRRYGGVAPICNKDIRKKSSKGFRSNPSSLERRLQNILNEYHIRYESEYVIQGKSFTHSFDLYLPDHNILIDCDGMFYHGYLDDPDGKWVLPFNDTRRLELIPEGTRFLIIVEDDFERGLSLLMKMLKENLQEYESDIFKWCRSVGFPYPSYEDKRMTRDYAKLSGLDVTSLPMNCWFGLSSIQNFHKSLWDCKVGSNLSPKEAWYDDDLLKKVIANRLIYIDNLNPSNVLRGFNISKIGPRVSIFNPVLAKYLVIRYLDRFDSVFDPFSGFSGRLLGTCSSGKRYIGQDIRKASIDESKAIAEFHELNASLACKSIFESSGEFDCLFTCPPYQNKEIYQCDDTFLSCDAWIQECLDRFHCKHYLFVVDRTEEFEKYVVEEIRCASHFRKSSEYVISILDSDI